jgi:hypothetical protein
MRTMPDRQPGKSVVIVAFACLMSKMYRLQPGQQPLRKKNRGRLIHVSDFISEETGRLVIRDHSGQVVRDARKIIFPGSGHDKWWDCAQLLDQMREAISIHNELHPDSQALFIFDQSSAHASLPPDALRAFDMNMSDGGKQRVQRDTIIPQTNPTEAMRGQAQKMTLQDGSPKGLKRVLQERGFDVTGLKAKCAPVCPFESRKCCMARLLSQQEDFVNQVSMLEALITEAGHLCIFLPKFHCELNPIEMVSSQMQIVGNLLTLDSTGAGLNFAIAKSPRRSLPMQRQQL